MLHLSADTFAARKVLSTFLTSWMYRLNLLHLFSQTEKCIICFQFNQTINFHWFKNNDDVPMYRDK